MSNKIDRSGDAVAVRASGLTKPSLGALTAAAMALPGIAGAQVPAAEPAGVQVDYLFSHYRESDIPGGRTINGESSERYEISTHSFRVLSPLGERTLGVDLMYETLSGASPWFVQPDVDGEPVQVMSRPTIDEERIDASVSLRNPLTETLALNLQGGFSDEDDYRSIYGNVGVELNPDRGPLTLTASLGYASDTLEPTQGATPTSTLKDDKRSLRLNAGASYILNRVTVVQASVGYQDHSGFLSDPYKAAFIESIGGTVFDSRPDGRRAHHVLARIRHFVEPLQGALHADYRYYRDDWKIHSHTVELTWHQTLPDYWRVSPGVRWYSQSQAFFYAPFYAAPRTDGFASSDYRLSPFGALSFRLDVTKGWNRWAFGGGVEHYEAKGSYAAGSVRVENPGLVRYTAFNARVAFAF
jgi:hypothetical protein